MTHTPLQTTYRNMPPSDAVEEDIRQRLAKLDEVSDRITSCRVLVEAPTEHHRHGGLFHVRVEVALPGEVLVVGDPPDHDHAHEDAHTAIRDAFRAARRGLVTRRASRSASARTAQQSYSSARRASASPKRSSRTPMRSRIDR